MPILVIDDEKDMQLLIKQRLWKEIKDGQIRLAGD